MPLSVKAHGSAFVVSGTLLGLDDTSPRSGVERVRNTLPLTAASRHLPLVRKKDSAMTFANALVEHEAPRCSVGRIVWELDRRDAAEAQALRTLLTTRGPRPLARVIEREAGIRVDPSQVFKHQRGRCSCVPGHGR